MKTFFDFIETTGIPVFYYRYVHRNGMGLMNNQGLNRDRLSDDEEADLVDLMDFGLRQPIQVPSGAIFAFTEEGRQQHLRLINLLKKASVYGVTMQKLPSDKYRVIWNSGDGQVGLLPITSS